MVAPLLPYDGMDMRSLIQAQAARHAEHAFLIWEPFAGVGRTWTYSEFLDAVRTFAAGLHARGLSPGERLPVHLDNCPEFLLPSPGCASAGGVRLSSNTTLCVVWLSSVSTH